MSTASEVVGLGAQEYETARSSKTRSEYIQQRLVTRFVVDGFGREDQIEVISGQKPIGDDPAPISVHQLDVKVHIRALRKSMYVLECQIFNHLGIESEFI